MGKIKELKESVKYVKSVINGYIKIYMTKILFILGTLFLGGFILFFAVFSFLSLFVKPNVDEVKKLNSEYLLKLEQEMESEKAIFMSKQKENWEKIADLQDKIKIASNSIEVLKATAATEMAISSAYLIAAKAVTPTSTPLAAKAALHKNIAIGITSTATASELILAKHCQRLIERKLESFVDFQYTLPEEIDWQTILTFAIILDKKYSENFVLESDGNLYINETKYYETTTESGLAVEKEISKDEYLKKQAEKEKTKEENKEENKEVNEKTVEEKLADGEDVLDEIDLDKLTFSTKTIKKNAKEVEIQPSYGQEMSPGVKESIQIVLKSYFKKLYVETCNVSQEEVSGYLVKKGFVAIPQTKKILEPQKIMNCYVIPKTLDELFETFGCNEDEKEEIRANLSMKLSDDEDEKIDGYKTKLNYIEKIVEGTTVSSVVLYDDEGKLREEFNHPFEGRERIIGIKNEVSENKIEEILENLLEKELKFHPGNPIKNALDFSPKKAYKNPTGKDSNDWGTMKKRFAELKEQGKAYYKKVISPRNVFATFLNNNYGVTLSEYNKNYTKEDKFNDIKKQLEDFIFLDEKFPRSVTTYSKKKETLEEINDYFKDLLKDNFVFLEKEELGLSYIEQAGEKKISVQLGESLGFEPKYKDYLNELITISKNELTESENSLKDIDDKILNIDKQEESEEKNEKKNTLQLQKENISSKINQLQKECEDLEEILKTEYKNLTLDNQKIYDENYNDFLVSDKLSEFDHQEYTIRFNNFVSQALSFEDQHKKIDEQINKIIELVNNRITKCDEIIHKKTHRLNNNTITGVINNKERLKLYYNIAYCTVLYECYNNTTDINLGKIDYDHNSYIASLNINVNILDNKEEEQDITSLSEEEIEEGIKVGKYSKEAVTTNLRDHYIAFDKNIEYSYLSFTELDKTQSVKTSNHKSIEEFQKAKDDAVFGYILASQNLSMNESLANLIKEGIPEEERETIKNSLQNLTNLTDEALKDIKDIKNNSVLIVDAINETLESYKAMATTIEHDPKYYINIISETIENDIAKIKEEHIESFLNELQDLLSLNDEEFEFIKDFLNNSNNTKENFIGFIELLEVNIKNNYSIHYDSMKGSFNSVIAIANDFSIKNLTKETAKTIFKDQIAYYEKIQNHKWKINGDSLNFFADIIKTVFGKSLPTMYDNFITGDNNDTDSTTLFDNILEKLKSPNFENNSEVKKIFNKLKEIKKDSNNDTITNEISDIELENIAREIYAHALVLSKQAQEFPDQAMKLFEEYANINKHINMISKKSKDISDKLKTNLNGALKSLQNMTNDHLEKLNNLASKGKLYILKIKNINFHNELGELVDYAKKMRIAENLRKGGIEARKIIESTKKIAIYVKKSGRETIKAISYLASKEQLLVAAKGIVYTAKELMNASLNKETYKDAFNQAKKAYEQARNGVVTLMSKDWSVQIDKVDCKVDFSGFGKQLAENIAADRKSLTKFLSNPLDGFGTWFLTEHLDVLTITKDENGKEILTWKLDSIAGFFIKEDLEKMEKVYNSFKKLGSENIIEELENDFDMTDTELQQWKQERSVENWNNLLDAINSAGEIAIMILDFKNTELGQLIENPTEFAQKKLEGTAKQALIDYIVKEKGLDKWCEKNEIPVKYITSIAGLRNSDDVEKLAMTMITDPAILNALIKYVGLDTVSNEIAVSIFGQIKDSSFSYLSIGDIIATIVELATGSPKYTVDELVLSNMAFNIVNGNRDYSVVDTGVYKNLKFYNKGSDNFEVIKYIAEENNIPFDYKDKTENNKKITKEQQFFNDCQFLGTMLSIEDMKNTLIKGDIGFTHDPNNYNTDIFGIFSGEYENNKPLFYYFQALEPPKDFENRDMYFDNGKMVVDIKNETAKLSNYYQDTKYTLSDDFIKKEQEKEEELYILEQLNSEKGIKHYQDNNLEEKINNDLQKKQDEIKKKQEQENNNPGSTGKPTKYTPMTDEECYLFKMEKLKEYLIPIMKDKGDWIEWDPETMSKYHGKTKEDFMSDVEKGNFVKDTANFTIFVRYFNKAITESVYEY